MLSIASSQLVAQKIRYKDLFPLLDTKQYKEVLPKLAIFLSDEKNDDHANAHFQMGIYLEQRAKSLDPITQTNEIESAADSASLFLNKALPLIDEKELKKNDEYYQSFNRRDLRTGEFGIKLSDVKLDIEKKIEALSDLKANSNQLVNALSAIENSYGELLDQFISWGPYYLTENNIMLQSNDLIMEQLESFIDQMTEIQTNVITVEEMLKKLPTQPFSFNLKWLPVDNFGTDTPAKPDFYNGDFQVYEFKDWARGLIRTIEKEIIPMRELSINYDNSLIELENEIRSGSEISIPDFPDQVDPEVESTLKRFDNNPYPFNVFEIRIERMSIEYLASPIYYPQLEDTLDVNFQVAQSDTIVKLLKKFESLILDLLVKAKNSPVENHQSFFETQFGSKDGYVKFLSNQKKWVNEMEETWNPKFEYWTERGNWSNNIVETDTINLPLFKKEDPSFIDFTDEKFLCLATVVTQTSDLYSAGIEYMLDKKGHGEVKGYVARISNPRELVWKENFDLDPIEVGINISQLQIGFIQDTSSAYFFFYAPASTHTQIENLLLAKFDPNGSQKWVSKVVSPQSPKKVDYNIYSGLTTFYLQQEDPELEPTTLVFNNIGEPMIDE